MNVTLSQALGADPVLPQRNLLLDGGAMADRLSGSLTRGSLAVERCAPLRAKYQPGRSLRVLYRVTTERSRDLVALRTFEDRRGAEVCRQAEATAVPSE